MKALACFLLSITLGLVPGWADPPDLAGLQARAAKGDAEAELDLGRDYHLGKGVPQNIGKAVVFYRQAADQGNAKAMYNLGYIYFHGQGRAQDIPTAFQWFEKAADKGLPAAQLKLGLLYYFGDEGVKQNYTLANKWLTLAARQPNAPAQNAPAADALGAMYEGGLGVTPDKKQTFYWYSKAAELGNTRAESNLGRIYMEGQLVKKDPAQSYMWLKMAALRGDLMATHLLPDYLANKMYNAAQIAEGDRKIKEYQAQHPWQAKLAPSGRD